MIIIITPNRETKNRPMKFQRNDDDDDEICILLPLNGYYYVNKQPSNILGLCFDSPQIKQMANEANLTI